MSNYIKKLSGSGNGSNAYCFVFVRPELQQETIPLACDVQTSNRNSLAKTTPEGSVLSNLRKAALFCLKANLSPTEKKQRYTSLLDMISYGIQNEFDLAQKMKDTVSIKESQRRIKSYEIALCEIWESYKKDFPNEEFPV